MLRHALIAAASFTVLAQLALANAYAQSPPGWRWSDLKHRWQHQSRVGTRDGVVTLGVRQHLNNAVLELKKPGSKGWRTILRAPIADAGAITSVPGIVFAVHYSARTTGGAAYAFETKTGRMLWRRQLKALGPQNHSQYANDIRVAAHNGHLAVFGQESNGRYVELRDARSGRLLRHTRVPSWLAGMSWNWKGPPNKRSWYKGAIRYKPPGAFTYVFTNVRNKGRFVSALGPRGRQLWKLKLTGSGFCGNAAMVKRQRTLYVVAYCSISTGATLHAINASKGRRKWSKHLVGIGPVGHSKYFNSVQVELRRGLIVIYGNEASGKYVEARDPANGQLIANRSFN